MKVEQSWKIPASYFSAQKPTGVTSCLAVALPALSLADVWCGDRYGHKAGIVLQQHHITSYCTYIAALLDPGRLTDDIAAP